MNCLMCVFFFIKKSLSLSIIVFFFLLLLTSDNFFFDETARLYEEGMCTLRTCAVASLQNTAGIVNCRVLQETNYEVTRGSFMIICDTFCVAIRGFFFLVLFFAPLCSVFFFHTVR